MLSRSIRLSLGLLRPESVEVTLSAGIKYFPPPKNYDHIEIPERPRLRVYEKVPVYPPNLKPPKMQKRLRYMRGPEPLHTTLQLKQYGVVGLAVKSSDKGEVNVDWFNGSRGVIPASNQGTVY